MQLTKLLYVLAIISISSGCAHTRKDQHLNHTVLGEGEVLTDQASLIREAANHIRIGYGDSGDEKQSIDERIKAFNDLGYNASYYSTKSRRRWYLNNFPELFILSKPQSNTVIVQFIGTNSFFDWIENAKAKVYEDEKPRENPDKIAPFYIPKAHGGFRRGAMELINSGFFHSDKYGLNYHVKKYNVRQGDGDIKVVLTGHSLGAALAVLMANAMDGHLLENSKYDTYPGWKYTVKNLYLFATPYTLFYGKYGVSGEELDSKDYDLMVERYERKTYNVQRTTRRRFSSKNIRCMEWQ